MKHKRLHCLMLVALLGLALAGVWLTTAPPWLCQATAPGQRPHSLARPSLPNGDLALVALPALPSHAGEIALWWAGNDAPAIQTLIRVEVYLAD